MKLRNKLSKAMGTQLLLLLQLPTPTLASLPLLNLYKFSNTTEKNILRCNFAGSRRADGRFRFDPQKSSFSDDDEEFEFTSSGKKRIWWSDFDDYDNEDVGDFEEDDEFLIFKVFRAFGWMLPAIGISLLLGTGTNAFIMALAVPLGQSALSLVFDQVAGKRSKSWKSTSRPKTKKKNFTRSANNVRTNKGKQAASKTGGGKASYSSWLNMDGGMRDKGAKKRAPNFGGWDQLDDQVDTQKNAPSQEGNGLPKQRKKGKYSTLGRARDTPLLLRLLIAVFPFLGSWTRFLF